MLARETGTTFDDPGWIYEIKWDGYRAIAEVKNGEAELYSRNANSFKRDYPLIVTELEKIKHELVLDGEVVVLNEDGYASFQKLQHYEENTQYPICYYVFDVLRINGMDTTQLPLTERKKLLKKALPKSKIIRYSDHIAGDGIAFFEAARKNNLEGIMAKKGDSTYDTGTRTGNWLKIKHHHSDEVVIVGFTEPTGSRPYFGALVLARPSEEGWIYAGHTGTGFNDAMLKEVYGKLKKIVTKTSPFAKKIKTNTPVTWVKPEYIAEIKFTEITDEGSMRHPVFLRLRNDKKIKDLVMATTKKPAAKKAAPVKKTALKRSATPTKTSEKKSGEKKPLKKGSVELKIGKETVILSNQDKLYWPEDKITKGDMVNYYQRIAPYILPYLKDRPESLKRNPNGIHDPGFFHKDAGDDAPPFVKSTKLFSESANKDIDYIICNDKATLAYLNNLGCIELNPWNSTTQKLDNPDYLLIDIDPADKNTFEQVIETALAYKKLLTKAGADCYCKTSGSTGLHIFVPMGKKYDYEMVKNFAHLLSQMVQEILPAFTSLERNLKKRGQKIYLDYLQNRRGQTIACAYSLRPKKGATVSTPLEWKEVKKGLHPSKFTIHNIEARLKAKGDLFKGVLGKGVNIESCLRKLGAGESGIN